MLWIYIENDTFFGPELSRRMHEAYTGAYRFPCVWCPTNTCIAADLADPKLIKEMETGQKLQLEVVDSSVLAVTTALPINQFAAVRQGPPTQTFEQNIDE